MFVLVLTSVLFISSVFASSIPSGYIRLEYIESTGTQWIDTGIVISDKTLNTSVEFKAIWITSDYSNVSILGTKSHENMGRTFCEYERQLYCGDANNRILYNIPDLNNPHTLKGIWTAQNNMLSVYVDDVLQGAAVQTGDFSDASIKIASNGDAGGKFVGKIYEFKLTSNDLLVFNGVPAQRKSDNEIGLYDTVSQTFFANSGTGTFNAGPLFCATKVMILGANVCLIESQPSGPYLTAKYNNNTYYMMLNSSHDYPIHKDSNNKLKIKIGNTIYNAHDLSVQ